MNGNWKGNGKVYFMELYRSNLKGLIETTLKRFGMCNLDVL